MEKSNIKTSKLKARRMWAINGAAGLTMLPTGWKRLTKRSKHDTVPDYIPVAVIPLDDIEGIRDRMAEAFSGSYDGHLAKDDLTAMLVAIGVLPKQRKGRK